MSAEYKHQQASYGELMRHLIRERERYPSEEEFKAFALAEVRRFIADLRTLDIEVAMRHGAGRPNVFASPKE